MDPLQEAFETAKQIFGGDSEAAKKYVQEVYQQYKQDVSGAKSQETYKPNFDTAAFGTLTGMTKDLNKANVDNALTLGAGMQPFFNEDTRRQLERMTGAADQQLRIQQDSGGRRERMFDKALEFEKGKRGGQMFDRILRGAALVGAMFS